MTDDLKVGTRYYEFILGWLPWITHRPGIDEAELMSTSTLGAEFGNRVVEAVANVDRVLGSEFYKAEHEYNGFVVNCLAYVLEGNSAIPCAKYQRFEGEV